MEWSRQRDPTTVSQREITLFADLSAIHIRPIARGNSIIARTFVSVGETLCMVRSETRRCGCHGREKCLRREPLPRGNASLGSIPLPCSREECEYAIAKVGDTVSRDNSYRRVPVWSALIRHESHHTDCSRSCSYTIHAPMRPCRALQYIYVFSYAQSPLINVRSS